MKRRIWQRNVALDKGGEGWTGGARAVFIFDLFMKGYAIQELADGICEGYMTIEMVEDAIRYGLWRSRRDRSDPRG